MAVLAIAASVAVGCGDDRSDSRVADSSSSKADPGIGELPTGESLLLRTDFSDDEAWQQTLDSVNVYYEPEGLNVMYGLTVVNDPAFRGVGIDSLDEFLTSQAYVYIVDDRTIRDPEHPLLAVDNSGGGVSALPGFRILPSEVGEMEVNLTLGSSDFEDFAAAVDPDGVLRGGN